MSTKPPRDRKTVLPGTPPKPDDRKDASDVAGDAARHVFGQFALSGMGWLLTMMGILVVGLGGVVLGIAWHLGPEVMLEHAQYRKFTGRADGRIVESWLAMDLAVGEVTNPQFWRASTRASPCIVVTYEGDWGSPLQRGFCGARLGFNTNYTLVDLAEVAQGVPFAWARDERGFALPELRMSAPARAWLAGHDAHTFMHKKWPAKTELDWLRLELDQPVDAAIVGWSARPASVPLAFDPAHPDAALPLGTVESRLARGPSVLAIVFLGALGLVIWLVGMWILPLSSGTLMEGMAHPGRWVLAILPLLALPWWADYFPRAVASINAQTGALVAQILGDADPLDRMHASAPEAADLARGDRLVLRAGTGVYADTFGRFRYTVPVPAPATPDAALAALTASLAAQARELEEPERIALFERLRRDKLLDLRAAGIAFLPAAKEARADSQSPPGVQRAARNFLVEWRIEPTDYVDPRGLAFEERKRITASIQDLW